MLNRRSFLGYSCLFLGGCSLVTTTTSSPQVNRPEKLRFAVTDLSGPDDLERDFGAFRQALETVLELPVEFFPVESYLAAAPAFLANELEFAMAGPSEYLLLRARAKAVPIVGITRLDYYSMIMARANGDIESLADLKGRTIAMRTEGSTAGHIVPMKLLLDAGLQPDDYTISMLNREGSEALIAGQVDAWADSRSRYEEYVQKPGREDEFQVLSQGENLPPDIFVANPNLAEGFIAELKTKLLDNQATLMSALTASEANHKYQESDMVLVEDADYQSLRDSYYAIGQGSAIE